MDNPALVIEPGGYGVHAPPSGGGADPGEETSTWFREVPVHPAMRPEFREALATWRAWAERNPDAAREALKGLPEEELRQMRDDLRHALQELEAVLAAKRPSE
jgi:hypothetical protein